jgi:hypothetical protein
MRGRKSEAAAATSGVDQDLDQSRVYLDWRNLDLEVLGVRVEDE